MTFDLDKLSDWELDSLSNAVYDQRVMRQKRSIKARVDSLPPLTDKEKETANYVSMADAGIAYSHRTGLSLYDAHLAVDKFLSF